MSRSSSSLTDHVSTCRHCSSPSLSRREMLLRSANGFGAVAVAALLSEEVRGGALSPHGAHFPARAKSVIFLYMDGGPSQVDTFDPKPRLTKEHGRPFSIKVEPPQCTNNRKTFTL